MNTWIGKGRLVADPELKYTENGIPKVKFAIVAREFVKGASGSSYKTSLIPIVAYNKLAENIAANLHKGSDVLVDGRIDTFKYERDNQTFNGWNIAAKNVEFLEWSVNKTDNPQEEDNDDE